MAHQEHVLQLVRPGGDIHGLLVDHHVGSGKTRTTIAVLDAYFTMPVARLAVFRKQSICRNFYRELLQ